jgi:multidrug efflux pump subunit AcrB
MAKTKTHTGLKVFTTVLEKAYKTGRKVTENFKQTMEIVFDDYLPQTITGGQPRAVRVDLDPDKLASYKLSPVAIA